MRKAIIAFAIGCMLVAGVVVAGHKAHKGYRGWGNAPHHQGNAAGLHRKDGRNPVKALLAMKDELDLSDAQVADLKKRSFDFRTNQVDLKADVAKARIELQQLKHDEDASEQEVMKAIDKVSQARAELEKLKYRFHADVRSTLSEEQREKMKELHITQPRRGQGHMRGPGPFIEKEVIIEDDGGI